MTEHVPPKPSVNPLCLTQAQTMIDTLIRQRAERGDPGPADLTVTIHVHRGLAMRVQVTQSEAVRKS